MGCSFRTAQGVLAGVVVGEPTPGHFLVRIDPDASSGVPVGPLELVSAYEMGPDGEIEGWKFFTSRADLDAWLGWIAIPAPEAPASPKVARRAKKNLQ